MDETKLAMARETIRQWLSDMSMEEFRAKADLRLERSEAEKVILEAYDKLHADYESLRVRYDIVKVYESAGLKFIEEIEEHFPKVRD